MTTLAKSAAPPPSPPVPQHDPRYTVGTLTYTRRSLVAMFVWMLCGNVAFTLMEAVFPGGVFVGYCHNHYGLAGYSGVWLWICAFDILALLCMLLVWGYWRRMGGEHFSFDPETCAVVPEDPQLV